MVCEPMLDRLPEAIDSNLDEQTTDTQKTEKTIEVMDFDNVVDDSVVDSEYGSGIARKGAEIGYISRLCFHLLRTKPFVKKLFL